MQLTQWQESIAVVPGNKVGGRAEGGEFGGGGCCVWGGGGITYFCDRSKKGEDGY